MAAAAPAATWLPQIGAALALRAAAAVPVALRPAAAHFSIVWSSGGQSSVAVGDKATAVPPAVHSSRCPSRAMMI